MITPRLGGLLASRCIQIARLLASVAVGLIGMGSVPDAHACCNVIPEAQKFFPSELGQVSAPFARPGDVVAIQRTDTAAFAEDPSQNVITLRFRPPGGGPETTLAGTPALPPGAGLCNTGDCSAGRCSCMSFVFPDTDDKVGQPADGRPLTGPVEISVETAGTTSGRIARLFFPGTSVRDDVFPSFVALPPKNPFGALEAGPGGEVLVAPDDAGNLFIPMDFAGLASPKALQTRFVEAMVGGIGSLSGLQFDTFSVRGIKLPPLLRAVDADTLVGTVDAPESVLRVGSGITALGLLAEEGKGAIAVPGVTGTTDPARRGDASTIISGARFVVYENRECGLQDAPSDCLDLNGDGDQTDILLLALDLTAPGATPLLIDSVDASTFPGSFPARPLYHFIASDQLVAFEIAEQSDSDIDGNG